MRGENGKSGGQSSGLLASFILEGILLYQVEKGGVCVSVCWCVLEGRAWEEIQELARRAFELITE